MTSLLDIIELPDPLLRQLGVSRGIVVVLGDEAAATAQRFAANRELMVYVRHHDPDLRARLPETLRSL